MTTATANYGWQMPDPGGSANTWGNTLNATTQAIDAQVFIAIQAGVPVGAVTMWVGGSAPANWRVCDGSSLSTTTYATLFAVIGYAFGGSGGSFNLPNLDGRFPVGAYGAYSLNDQGGENSHTLSLGEIPPHAHGIQQTVHGHNVTVSGGAHAHGISDVDPGHTHSVNQVFGGGSEIASGSGWGQHTVASGGAGTGISTTDTQTPSISVSVVPAYANINGNSTDNAGSGAAHENRPPFIALNFIIRVT